MKNVKLKKEKKMSKLKLAATIFLSIVAGCFLLTIGVGVLGGLLAVFTPTNEDNTAVNSVVQNTVEEETTTEPQETTEPVSESEEETSSVEESSTEPQESSVKEEPSEKETPKEETKPSFTYKGSDGTIFNSIEELQQWIYDNDRSISSFEEVYAMSEQELIDAFEERLRIWADEEYNDFGDEGFWDNPEDFITDYPTTINSIKEFKDWFREGKKGDILEINSSLTIMVSQIVNDKLLIRLYDNNLDTIGFYVYQETNGQNVLRKDYIAYLKMEYSDRRCLSRRSLSGYRRYRWCCCDSRIFFISGIVVYSTGNDRRPDCVIYRNISEHQCG